MFIQAFFEGIITALGALVLELSTLTLFNLPLPENSLFTLFIFVIIEELIKYVLIYNHYLKSTAREKIIHHAFLIGLGFSLMELFLKQLDYQKITSLPVAGIFFIHLFTSSVVGFFFWKKYNKNIFAILSLIILNIALHFSYNFMILRYF